MEGIEHIEMLPVMDFKNKSIPTEAVTSFDVNKAIQRSLTKAVARHGLGLYIYAGEDLPEDEMEEIDRDAKISATAAKAWKERLGKLGDKAPAAHEYLLKKLGIDSIEDMPAVAQGMANAIMTELEDRAKGAKA